MNTLIFNRNSIPPPAFELKTHLNELLYPHSFPNFKFHNSTKDILSVASNLEISFLWKFTSTLQGLKFEICRTPQGPTLEFNVLNYATLQTPPVTKEEALTIFSGFDNTLQSKLSKQLFQSLFPSLDKNKNPQRIILINYDPKTQKISLRHYRFTNNENVSQLLLALKQQKLNFSSYESFEQLASQTTSSPLYELGPRIDFELTKAMNNVFDGAVLFNKFVEVDAQKAQKLAKKAEIRIQDAKKHQRLIAKLLSEKQRKAKKETEKQADDEEKDNAKLLLQGDQEGGKMGIQGKQVYSYVHKTRSERREREAEKKKKEEAEKVVKGKGRGKDVGKGKGRNGKSSDRVSKKVKRNEK